MVEYEKFRDNLKTWHRVSAEWTAKKAEFNRLLEETQSARAEIRALHSLLDKTALQLGLESLVSGKNELRSLCLPSDVPAEPA